MAFATNYSHLEKEGESEGFARFAAVAGAAVPEANAAPPTESPDTLAEMVWACLAPNLRGRWAHRAGAKTDDAETNMVTERRPTYAQDIARMKDRRFARDYPADDTLLKQVWRNMTAKEREYYMNNNTRGSSTSSSSSAAATATAKRPAPPAAAGPGDAPSAKRARTAIEHVEAVVASRDYFKELPYEMINAVLVNLPRRDVIAAAGTDRLRRSLCWELLFERDIAFPARSTPAGRALLDTLKTEADTQPRDLVRGGRDHSWMYKRAVKVLAAAMADAVTTGMTDENADDRYPPRDLLFRLVDGATGAILAVGGTTRRSDAVDHEEDTDTHDIRTIDASDFGEVRRERESMLEGFRAADPHEQMQHLAYFRRAMNGPTLALYGSWRFRNGLFIKTDDRGLRATNAAQALVRTLMRRRFAYAPRGTAMPTLATTEEMRKALRKFFKKCLRMGHVLAELQVLSLVSELPDEYDDGDTNIDLCVLSERLEDGDEGLLAEKYIGLKTGGELTACAVNLGEVNANAEDSSWENIQHDRRRDE